MGRSQWIAVAITAVLLTFTFVACPVQPPELADGLAKAPLESTGLESLIRAARSDLSPAQMATLATLEDRLESQTEEEERLELLEQLAGEWYRAQQPAISGIYARQIAETRGTAEAWGLAATTFSLCLRNEEPGSKTHSFCGTAAINAYQSAISLAPGNVDNRINLALTYTDAPPNGQPMKGILMLRDLVDQYPKEARVYTTLAQLAIRTGQLEKAAERLETAAELAPEDPNVFCPLARVHEQLGNSDKSAIFAARCSSILEDIEPGSNK